MGHLIKFKLFESSRKISKFVSELKELDFILKDEGYESVIQTTDFSFGSGEFGTVVGSLLIRKKETDGHHDWRHVHKNEMELDFISEYIERLSEICDNYGFNLLDYNNTIGYRKGSPGLFVISLKDKKVNEINNYIDDYRGNEEKLIKEIINICFIVEDEGYEIEIEKYPKNNSAIKIWIFKPGSIDTEAGIKYMTKSEIKIFMKSEFYIEFEDRLSDICNINGFNFSSKTNAFVGTILIVLLPNSTNEEFINGTRLGVIPDNQPDNVKNVSGIPDRLGNEDHILTINDIIVYLKKKKNSAQDIKSISEEKSGVKKISFEMEGFNVDIYRAIGKKNKFEYTLSIDDKEIDCSNDIG